MGKPARVAAHGCEGAQRQGAALAAGCNDRHGFWLDQGEAIRVRELVEERVQGLERSAKAEAEWGNFIDDLKDGPSFWDRLTGKG